MAKNNAKSNPNKLSISVTIGQCGVGKSTANAPFKLSLSSITEESIKHFFRGAQVEVVLRVDPNAKKGEGNQDTMDCADTDIPDIQGVANIRRHWCSDEECGATLSFNRKSIDYHDLVDHSFKSTKLTMEYIGKSGVGNEE